MTMDRIYLFVSVPALFLAAPGLAQGPLAPPGAPAPTMKTLEQVEPRIPIDNLPYSITNPGSYYVTADLTGTAGQDGITIGADNVTIDLNGFSLEGGGVSGHGIGRSGTRRNLAIRNGTLYGWPQDGVGLTAVRDCRLADLTVYGNAGSGIAVGEGSIVRACVSTENGGFGITGGNGVVLEGCTATDNSNDGINLGNSATVMDCTANDNADGIEVGEGSTVQGCTARDNTLMGIRTGNACTISECSVSQNDGVGIQANPGCTIVNCSSTLNGQDGIFAQDGSIVRSCTATANQDDGIVVTSDCRVEGNMSDGNGTVSFGGGILVTGTGNEIRDNTVLDADQGLAIAQAGNVVAGNIVRGNGENYAIVPGNQLNLLLCEIPEVIEWPASVKLVGTLTGVSGESGIKVLSNDVTIDLGGHALVGVPGSIHGISAASGTRRITVRNGTVQDWGHDGVVLFLSESCVVEDVRAVANAFDHSGEGIGAGNQARVSRCQSIGNGGTGIRVSENSLVFESLASSNTGFGIVCWIGSKVMDCIASGNGIGIAGSGCAIRQCISEGNGSGFSVSYDGTVEDCHSYGNTSFGIQGTRDSRFVGNLVQNNGISGIRLAGGGNVIEGNTVTSNNVAGIHLLAGGNQVSDNIVRGSTNNYDLVAGNKLNIILSELPESIDWPASVKLAGTLTGMAGTNGITIASDDVTIDLNGHALVGVSNSAFGIVVNGAAANVTVRNGIVRDWGRTGLALGGTTNCVVADVQAYANGLSGTGGSGILVGEGARVERCESAGNEQYGISASSGSLVQACTVYDNETGIVMSGSGAKGCTVTRCVARDNSSTGLFMDAGLVTESIATGNGFTGINLANNSTARDCEARDNGLYGIRAGVRSHVANNTCASNGDSGIALGSRDSHIEGNTVIHNLRGLFADDGIGATNNLIIRNTAIGNTTNFVIGTGNRVGVITTPPLSGVISGSAGGAGAGTTDPWANIAY